MSPDSTSRLGYVYFVRCPVNGLIKIGFSRKHPEDRLISMRSGSPVPLERLGFMTGSRVTEGELHMTFSRHLSHGEWFRPGSDLLDFIKLNALPWSPRSHKEATRRGIFYGPPVPFRLVMKATKLIRQSGVPSDEDLAKMSLANRRALRVAMADLAID